MLIELDHVTAMQVRVQLYVAAKRWQDTAQTYEGARDSIASMFRRKADDAFELMNEFRVACGEQPYTVEYMNGERDE